MLFIPLITLSLTVTAGASALDLRECEGVAAAEPLTEEVADAVWDDCVGLEVADGVVAVASVGVCGTGGPFAQADFGGCCFSCDWEDLFISMRVVVAVCGGQSGGVSVGRGVWAAETSGGWFFALRRTLGRKWNSEEKKNS